MSRGRGRNQPPFHASRNPQEGVPMPGEDWPKDQQEKDAKARAKAEHWHTVGRYFAYGVVLAVASIVTVLGVWQDARPKLTATPVSATNAYVLRACFGQPQGRVSRPACDEFEIHKPELRNRADGFVLVWQETATGLPLLINANNYDYLQVVVTDDNDNNEQE